MEDIPGYRASTIEISSVDSEPEEDEQSSETSEEEGQVDLDDSIVIVEEIIHIDD